MSDLTGTPEAELLQDIAQLKFNVALATGEMRVAESYLAKQIEALNRRIGDASVQLILMKDTPPNISSERQKLDFALQVLRLQGEESFDTEAVVAQFDSFAPGAPIIFVGEYSIPPRVIMSESRISVQPNHKKSGIRVGIDCRARSVNHHRDEVEPEEFLEFNSRIDICNLKDVIVGLPAFQGYIDAFPNSIPTDKKARQAYEKRIAHVFFSIEEMKKLGVEDASEIETKQLTILQSTVREYLRWDDNGPWQPSGRSGYGWWPRH